MELMTEDMDVEESREQRKARLRRKLEKLILRLEGIIDDLLAGVETSELVSRDRLVIATRFFGLYEHAIALEDTLGEDMDENRDSFAISTIIRQLKAEEEKEKEKFRIIEAEITPPCLGIEGGEEDDEWLDG
jgi:hypothetical protein